MGELPFPFPFCDSKDGAGLNVTELACEIRWLKFGKVSPAAWPCPAGLTLGLSKGHAWGLRGMAGEVGVIKHGGRGLFGGIP